MDRNAFAATEQSLCRRDQILDCLEELLDELPNDAITVAEITRCLGISRRAFYYYFPDKEACLCAFITRTFQKAMVYTAKNIPENPSALEARTVLLNYWKENRNFLDVIVRNRLTQFLLVGAKQFTVQADASLFPSDYDRDDDIVIGRVGATIAIVLRWRRLDYVTPTEVVAEKCLRVTGLWTDPQ